MKIRGLNRLKRVTRQFRNRFRPGVIILLYHRVAELSSDPYLLSVTPQHFAEHLEVLQQSHSLIPLSQLSQTLQDGKLPHRSVVVTFDDGYIDNLCNAKPLLEQYGIPATVFVASGYVGQDREFWWDELDRLLLQPGILPETLHLDINGSVYHWSLGEGRHYSEADAQRDRDWHLYQEHDVSSRHSLFRSLHQILNALPMKERWPVLDQLSVWAGAELRSRPTHRILTPEEVVQLDKGDLVEVGAHTVTHPILSSISVAAQQHEIYQSKADLEKILDRSVTSFAYPHGSRSDYSLETANLAEAAGFTCACSTVVDVVRTNSERFQLPRASVGDCDGETFARWLNRLISE